MRILLLLLVPVITIFFGCSKSSDEEKDKIAYGTTLNTWTFTEGAKTFSGYLLFDDVPLNTYKQANNSYNLDMAGLEKTSGFWFELNLDLLDLNFTKKTYQSGINGEYVNAFYYAESPASVEEIYKSSDLDPGPVMNYTITAYDAAKDIATITFNGKAQLENGTHVNITNGKVTFKIGRY
jgi:hypothetical protein